MRFATPTNPYPDPEPSPALLPSQVFRDVYKPKSARALLEAELGLEISDDAVKDRRHRPIGR